MSDLSFHVHHFMPDCAGEELELRKALLRVREYAAMRKAWQSLVTRPSESIDAMLETLETRPARTVPWRRHTAKKCLTLRKS